MVSFENIGKGAREFLKRFPVALAFLAGFTIHTIYLIIENIEPNACTFFFSVGLLLAVVLHLWTEDKATLRLGAHNAKSIAVWTIPFVLLLIDSIVLHSMDIVPVSTKVAHAVAIGVMVLAMLFLPFTKEKDDRMMCNFTYRFVINFIICSLIAGITTFALEMLYSGTAHLFVFEAINKVMSIIGLLTAIVLPVTLFLIRTPKGEKKHDTTIRKNGFLLGIVRYLALPIVVLYLAVLYVYGTKILFTWTLPNGWVATLVSILMCGIILVAFLLYPYLFDNKDNSREKTIMRWLPILALPLLVLMTVGIVRRFSDYGLTANRLYILTANLWFYAVAIGLWWNRSRRIHWIPLSAAVILVLTSCLPWNYCNTYYNTNKAVYERLITKYTKQPSFPNLDDWYSFLDSIPQSDAKALNDAICAMQNADRSLTEKMTGFTWWGIDTYVPEDGLEKEHPFGMDYEATNAIISIPDGYTKTLQINVSGDLIQSPTLPKDLAENVGYALNDSTFTCDIAEVGPVIIKHKGVDNNKQYEIPIPSKKALLIITKLNIEDFCEHIDPSYEMEATLFLK